MQVNRSNQTQITGEITRLEKKLLTAQLKPSLATMIILQKTKRFLLFKKNT